MATEPPTVRDVELRRAWPPVRIQERPERRREHGQIAIVSALAAITFLIVQPAGAVFGAVLSAFMCGAAIDRWQYFDDYYDTEVSES